MAASGNEHIGNFTSAFIDQASARSAVQLLLPTLEAAVDSHEAGASGFLYIVILRPGASPLGGSFDDAILHEHAIGNPDEWDADHGEFARAKARLSWRTGRDAATVLAQAPQLLAPGDTILPGAVVRHDMVVAVSGADPWYDDAFACMIADCLHAQARRALAHAAREVSCCTRLADAWRVLQPFCAFHVSRRHDCGERPRPDRCRTGNRSHRRQAPSDPFGRLTIEFKQTAPSRLYWAGRLAMQVVQALHWLKDSLASKRDRILACLKHRLASPEHGDAISQDLIDGIAMMPG